MPTPRWRYFGNIPLIEDGSVVWQSSLAGEPPEGVENVHFHPLESGSFRLVLRWRS